MLIFFNMVVNGLSLLFGFFGKFATFSNSFSALTNLRLVTRRILFVALIALIAVYIALEIAFYYYTAQAIVNTYNIISDLLVRITTMQSGGGSSSPLLQPLFLLLNSSGFASGLNTAFPFLASALIFRLMKFLYVVINDLHRRLIWLYFESVKLITGA